MLGILEECNVEKLRLWLKTKEGRREIWKFTCTLREKVEGPEKYLDLCQRTNEEAKKVGPQILKDLLIKFEPFIEAMPPGHDAGHLYREMLNVLALVENDPLVLSAAYQSDVLVGILGVFHDISNSLVHRYDDKKYRTGHAEVSAWMMFHFLRKMGFSEDLAYLIAYGIAAHTNYLTPLRVSKVPGFKRHPYWCKLMFEENKPWVLGPHIVRMADHLDGCGFTLVCRHILAQAGSLELGGFDMQEADFFAIDKKSLQMMLQAKFRDHYKGPPTVIEHCTSRSYSAFGGPYSSDYHRFKLMIKMIWEKTSETNRMVKVMTRGNADKLSLTPEMSTYIFKCTLKDISLSPYFDAAWEVLLPFWEGLPRKTQALWASLACEIQEDYHYFLKLVLDQIPDKSEYKDLAEEIVMKLIFNIIQMPD